MKKSKISNNSKLKGNCAYCGERIDKFELKGFSIICPHCKKIQNTK